MIRGQSSSRTGGLAEREIRRLAEVNKLQYNTINKFVTRTMFVQFGRIGGAGSRWWQMGNKRLKN